jgi:hypothetical protein
MENSTIIDVIIYAYATSCLIQLAVLWWMYTRVNAKNDRTPLTYVEPENKWTETYVSPLDGVVPHGF